MMKWVKADESDLLDKELETAEKKLVGRKIVGVGKYWIRLDDGREIHLTDFDFLA
jgi:hypothetical protein